MTGSGLNGREALRRRFDLTPGERVLDVGCGATPFPLATHLCDLTRSDDSQRFMAAMPAFTLPFVECGAEALPFRDKAFDFAYCGHVLEHVADPAAACRELERVAYRGYVECPASWIERVFHAPEHRWLVDHEGGRLLFREILEEERKDVLGLQFEILEVLRDGELREYWESPEVRRVRLVEYYWEGRLDFAVVPRDERRAGGSLRWFHGAAPKPPEERPEPRRARFAERLRRAIWKHASRHPR